MSFDPNSLAVLLKPFLPVRELDHQQLERVASYLELLLRWNSKINLTAIREPGQIITRHFGESFYAASQLYPNNAGEGNAIDYGSGAGFPGIPLALFAPSVSVTLIESHNKKATFLKEVVRALSLTNVSVFAGRAEGFHQTADVVTLRGVEKFEQSVSSAAKIVAKDGRLALLIGQEQVATAKKLTALASFSCEEPTHVPESSVRVLLVGKRN